MSASGALFDAAKRELRLESARLNSGDLHRFLALAEFFLAWRRERAVELGSRLKSTARDIVGKRTTRQRIELDMFGIENEDDVEMDDEVEARRTYADGEFFPKPLLSVLDVFTLNSVLKNMSESVEQKKLREVERSTSVYKEMLRAFAALRDGDRTERADRAKLYRDQTQDPPAISKEVSDGMLRLLFHAAEPTDPLPALLRDWRPGKHTKRYATDLVEIVHVTLKLIDDVQPYVARLAVPAALDLYASLLECYKDNSPTLNHYVYTFLFRLARTPLDAKASSSVAPNSATIATLEPLLYTVRFFHAFARLLDDKQADKSLAAMATLATDTLRHFDAHAARNPLLYVEALFSHGGIGANRWCRRLAAGYKDSSLMPPPDEQREDDDDVKRNLNFGDDDNRPEEEELDFDEAAKWDEDARKRADSAKKRKRELAKWTPDEDALLAAVLVKSGGSRDNVDVDRLATNTMLQPHHREVKVVRRRLGHIERRAGKIVADDVDLVAALRQLADKYKAKANKKKIKRRAPAKKTTTKKTTTKKKASDDIIDEWEREAAAEDNEESRPESPSNDDQVREAHDEAVDEAVDDLATVASSLDSQETEDSSSSESESDDDRPRSRAPIAVPRGEPRDASEKQGASPQAIIPAAPQSDDELVFDDDDTMKADTPPRSPPKRRRIVEDDDDDDD